MDRGVHKKPPDRCRLTSSPLCSTSVAASMADYGRADEDENSDPSETSCCKFRRRIGSSPDGSSATVQSPPHLDLAFLIWDVVSFKIMPRKTNDQNVSLASEPCQRRWYSKIRRRLGSVQLLLLDSIVSEFLFYVADWKVESWIMSDVFLALQLLCLSMADDGVSKLPIVSPTIGELLVMSISADRSSCCFPFLGLDFDIDKWISYDSC